MKMPVVDLVIFPNQKARGISVLQGDARNGLIRKQVIEIFAS
jgi:hypothetical protein